MRRFLTLIALIPSVAFAQQYGPQSSVFLGGTVPNATTFSSAITANGITPSSTLNVTMPASTPLVINSSGNGAGYVFNGAGASITGRLNFTPGTSNNAIVIGTANSSNTNQSIAFTPSGSGAQWIFALPNYTGTFSGPPVISSNCGGNVGAVLICNNSDTMNVTASPAYSLNVTRQFGGAGTQGSRIAANLALILTNATSDVVNSSWQAANISGEVRANAGGISGTPLGSLFSLGLYARAESGATNLLEVSGQENDMSIETGASAQKMHGVSVVSLSENSVAPGIEYTGFAVSGQGGSTATMTCAFCVGRYDGTNPLASTAAVMDLLPGAYAGAGPSVANGIDFRNGTFSNAAFETSGFSVKSSTLRIGRTFFTDSSTGLTITPTGSVGTSAAVASGGSGYISSLPLNAQDSNGGIWQMTISGGAVTAVTMLSAPYASGATPSNPVTLTMPQGQPGTGATINITWAAGTTTTLAGAIVVSGLPTSAPATHCAIWANAGVLTLTTCP